MDRAEIFFGTLGVYLTLLIFFAFLYITVLRPFWKSATSRFSHLLKRFRNWFQ